MSIENRVRKSLLALIRQKLSEAFDELGYDHFSQLTKIDPTVLRTLLEEDREKDLTLEQIIAIAEVAGMGVQFTYTNTQRYAHDIQLTVLPWKQTPVAK